MIDIRIHSYVRFADFGSILKSSSKVIMSIAERLGGLIMVNISRRNVLISTAFAGMTGLSGTASAAAAP